MPDSKTAYTYPESPVCKMRLSTESEDFSLIGRLEQYRLENKIPQQELASRLGVSFSTVNRWLNRKSQPNKIQTYHIEKLLRGE